MVATVELKKCMTHIGILGVVVGKLCHRNEKYSVILLPIYIGTKVCFYRIVLAFCLAVSLRVECGREPSLDVEEVRERGPKLRRENRIPVTYNRVREVVISYHHKYNYFR